MKRRGLLGVLALALQAGCVDSWPRASGPRTPPDPGAGGSSGGGQLLSVTDWDVGETEEGTLRVFGTIRNNGQQQATATVAVTVVVGEEKRTATSRVPVPADGTAEFSLTFEVAYEEFIEDGSVNLELG